MRRPHRNTIKLKKVATNIGIGFGAVLLVVICNGAVQIGISWLIGIHLGLNVFDQYATDTQRAQISVAALFIDGFLLLFVRRRWLIGRSIRLWRYIAVTVLILAVINLVAGVILPSYLFIRGQHGGDAGCNQNIGLGRAVQATYDVTTDTGGGTAFAIDTHGTLITAEHVIDGAKSITADDGSKLTVIKTNKAYDVALLKYPHATPDFLPLTSTYYVTDAVYEIGWPDNVDYAGNPTITMGIISRDISAEDAHHSGDKVPAHLSYIQTDAATNSGNSGGPIVDTCGAVGIMNSSSNSGDTTDPIVGINYATSSASARYALHLK